jgi:hypothetical protein
VVTVTGVPDAQADGPIPFTIVTGPGISSDPTYNGLDAADVSVTNLEACIPRPAPQVSVSPNGAGGLNVSVVSSLTVISELRFHGAPSAQVPSPNVLVDIGSLVGQGGEFTVPVGAQSVGFTIRRAVASGSATLPFEIVDNCGPWPTFVGGGDSAWGGSGSGQGDLAPAANLPPAARAAATSTPASIAPAPVPAPTSAVPGAACATFPSHAAAQAQLRANPSDPLNIDRNRNGIACEGADGAAFMSPPMDHTPVPRP